MEPSFLLPVGTVTFLLTDIEGSSRLWEADDQAMSAAVARHYEIIDDAVARHEGVRPVEQGEGDSVVAAFPRASDAAAAALDIQQAFVAEKWPPAAEVRVRVALHTGEAQLRDEGNYFGAAVGRCARLRSMGHGGQTLLSQSTCDLVLDRVPEGASLIDLGEHRLRDLTRPEHVWQLSHARTPGDFPPLRSLDSIPNNLPLQLTSFIGREAEVAEIRRLLTSSRTLTLIGSGGCGKTRLAIQAAADALEDYPHGAWWIDLAPISDPALVPHTVAAVLSINEVPNQPMADTLVRRLRAQKLMLVLDNCEHLIGACAELAEALIRACPGVTILATSREPLGVEGEAPRRIPSLALPEEGAPLRVETLTQYDAVRLFIDRATKVRPNFRVVNENAPAVAEICHRLDGIPLAIELAAARTRLLTPEQIAAGLNDRFRLLTGGARTALPRQRTLEASVDWSYLLLGEKERTLLQRLSVFAGGFTIDSAEQVCAGEEIEWVEILDLLSGLVDRSLVQVEEQGAAARYRLLETIRAYTRQKLSEGAQDAIRTRGRHLEYFIAVTERFEPEIEGNAQTVALAMFDREVDNIRAALDWAEQTGDGLSAQRMCGALWLYWEIRGRFTEGIARGRAALALFGGEPRARARTLHGIGDMSIFITDFEQVRDVEIEALAIGRELADDKLIGRALDGLGWAALFKTYDGDPLALFEEGIEHIRAAGDRWFYADAGLGVGFVHINTGKPLDGRPVLEDSLRAALESGNHVGAMRAEYFLGWIASLCGDYEEAERRLASSIERGKGIGETWFESLSWVTRGSAATARGSYESAQEMIERGLAIATDDENPFGISFGMWFLGELAYARGDLGEAGARLAEAFEILKQIGIFPIVWVRAMMGELARRTGDLVTARACSEEALSFGAGPVHAAGAKLFAGRIARDEGDEERAEALFHEALAASVESGRTPAIAEALEALARLSAVQESAREAARLLGAAQSLRDRIGYVLFPAEQPAIDETAAAARGALGDEDFEAALEEGRALSTEEAVAYASRARGERKRPSSGWASLTPTELEVVRLTATGLTNPQIGEQLFISRGTVKVHLSHVFAKLGVSTRAELASEATRRGV